MALEQLPMLPGQTTLVERVKYQLAVGSPFLFVTGDSGSGKTVFCEKLSSAIEEKYRCAFVPCNKKLTLRNLRELIFQQISPQTIFNQDDRLVGTIQRIDFGGKQVVIVIDNIDEADEKFLLELAEIHQVYNNKQVFHIVLTSTKEWAQARIRSLNDAGINPVEIEIPSLCKQDKIIELEYYYKVYGVRYQPENIALITPFAKLTTPEDVRKYAENSFKQNMDKIMEKQKEHENKATQTQDEKAPRKDINLKNNNAKTKSSKLPLILAIAALVAVVIGSAFYFTKKNPETSDITSTVAGDKATEKAIAVEPEEFKVENEDLNDKPIVIDKDKKDNLAKISLNDEAVQSINDEINKQNDTPKVQEVKENESSNSSTNEEKVEVKVGDDKASLDKTNKAKDLEANNTNKVANEKVAVNDTTISDKNVTDTKKVETKVDSKVNNQSEAPAILENTNQKVAPKSTDTSKVTTKETTKVATPKEEQQKVESKNVESSKAKEEKVETTSTKQNEKSSFNELDDKYYTVQIASNPKKAAIEKIVKNVSGKVWIEYRASKKDYIALWGEFKTNKEATQEIKTLPQSIQKSGPWAKKIGSVKAELK